MSKFSCLVLAVSVMSLSVGCAEQKGRKKGDKKADEKQAEDKAKKLDAKPGKNSVKRPAAKD